jgi:hypothetical protein
VVRANSERCGEREESERFVVPMKAGNRLDGTRWREGGAMSWNRERERWPRPRARQPSLRNSSG